MDTNNQSPNQSLDQQPEPYRADTPSIYTDAMPSNEPTGLTKRAKSLTIILVAIGAVLVLGGIIIAVLASMLTASKDDYVQAYDKVTSLSSSVAQLSSDVRMLQYGLTYSTDTTFKNSLEAAEKRIADIRSSNNELSEMKAVNVGEGKWKYNTVNQSINTHLTYASSALASLSDIRTTAIACSKTTGQSPADTKTAQSVIKACTTALQKVGDVANDDAKTYIAALRLEAEKLAVAIDGLAEISDPPGDKQARYDELSVEMFDLRDSIRNAETDFSSNFERHAKDADPKAILEDLVSFLRIRAGR